MSNRADHTAVQAFRANIAQIRDLLRIDDVLLGVPLDLLERVKEAQDKLKPPLQQPKARVDKVIGILRTVRTNASVAPRLQIMRNQSVVLAVSHFTSAIRSIFTGHLAAALASEPRPEIANQPIALSPAEVLDIGDDPSTALAEAVIRKKDVSFQDMKSIARAYKDFLGVEIRRDEVVNDVVLIHACRHAIVHAGGRVDQRLLNQIREASPRRLEPQLQAGAAIAFTDSEVLQAVDALDEYLVRVARIGAPGAV